MWPQFFSFQSICEQCPAHKGRNETPIKRENVFYERHLSVLLGMTVVPLQLKEVDEN